MADLILANREPRVTTILGIFYRHIEAGFYTNAVFVASAEFRTNVWVGETQST